ncbi:MAG: HEPN domain-containing protein [Methanobacteriota archaeon]
MAKDMRKSDAVRYLAQADEFLGAARHSLESEMCNAATFNAVQAMINANDALTVFYLGQRASSDHREGQKLHADVVKIINDGSQRDRLKAAMDLRSHAGYMGVPISKGDAEKTVRHAVQFVSWVRNRMK